MANPEYGVPPDTPLPECQVIVLIPESATTDPNLAYYSDYSQSHAEYTAVFAELALSWQWQPVTLDSYRQVINAFAASNQLRTVFLNLCDGDEVNGVPGLSVVRYLEETQACFTGADSAFYEATTSKFTMKERFAEAGVPSAPWARVTDESSCAGILAQCGTPAIVKPAVSAGSMGITVDSVVHTEDALRAQLDVVRSGYRGWDLAQGGVLVERFVVGREFTVFIIGSADSPLPSVVYPAIERVFNRSLPPTEQFLSFDRLWEIYEREPPLPNHAFLWEYAAVEDALSRRLAEVSWAAYASVGGHGYGRIDLRMDDATGDLFVLEVNAQCGLSADEDYTSIGAILRVAPSSFTNAIRRILAECLHVHASRNPAR